MVVAELKAGKAPVRTIAMPTTQMHKLETGHSACLWRIMRVNRAGHHRLQHIRSSCGSQPMEC